MISWLVVRGESKAFCFAKYGESIERLPSLETGSSRSHIVLIILSRVLLRLLLASCAKLVSCANSDPSNFGDEGMFGVYDDGELFVEEYVDENEENDDDDDSDLCNSYISSGCSVFCSMACCNVCCVFADLSEFKSISSIEVSLTIGTGVVVTTAWLSHLLGACSIVISLVLADIEAANIFLLLTMRKPAKATAPANAGIKASAATLYLVIKLTGAMLSWWSSI